MICQPGKSRVLQCSCPSWGAKGEARHTVRSVEHTQTCTYKLMLPSKPRQKSLSQLFKRLEIWEHSTKYRCASPSFVRSFISVLRYIVFSFSLGLTWTIWILTFVCYVDIQFYVHYYAVSYFLKQFKCAVRSWYNMEKSLTNCNNKFIWSIFISFISASGEIIKFYFLLIISNLAALKLDSTNNRSDHGNKITIPVLSTIRVE